MFVKSFFWDLPKHKEKRELAKGNFNNNQWGEYLTNFSYFNNLFQEPIEPIGDGHNSKI